MQRSNIIFRWLTGWLLLSILGVGVLGSASLSVHAAPRWASALDVIISEVAWGGTQAYFGDEWIELYNPGTVDINISGWTLSSSDSAPNITLTGTIPANGYFLLERTDDNTVSDLVANQIYTGDLNNSGEILTLRDSSSNIIDTANNENGGTWPAGSGSPGYYSMERIAFITEVDSAWASNDGVTRNGKDANGDPINGTPQNSVQDTVVISEVAWAGTQASEFDEWIELHNPGTQTVQLDGWILTNDSSSVYIAFDGSDSIGPDGYFLIERGSGNATSEIEQKIHTSGLLSDSGETLWLLDDTRQEIDTANSSGGAWPAGGGENASSMERVKTGGVVEPDSMFAWVTNVGTVKNGLDAAGNDIYGTPGSPNWSFTVLPTPSPTPTFTPTPTDELTIVISEVAWAGTQASTNDEWIELYNPGAVDINLGNWVLSSSDGSPDLTLSGTIQAGDYFLLERTDDDTVADITADLIYSGSLSNSGEILRLYDPNNVLVDTANVNGGAWPAGIASSHSSMQRSVIDDDGDYVWVTYDPANDTGTRAKDASGNDINGTPGRGNKPFNVTPTPTPAGGSSGSSGGSSGSSGGGVISPVLGISEFLPRPGHDWNNDGIVDVFDEFVEIINAGSIDVDLSNYKLDDERDSGSPPYSLPDITLEPGERTVFYASETGILLSDAGDTVRLLQGSTTVVDAYTYSVVRYPDQSWCRIPDRLGYWNNPCFPTPGNPNALTGTFPLPSRPEAGYLAPICLLPDTTPDEFVYAECEAGGDEIWNRQYWDGADAAESLIMYEPEKWETVFE